MHLVYGLTQHAGMGENVLDHRLNTRTVKMCWFNRFLYWNMNYHVEHHMFPMVPFHRLPELHEQIKGDLASLEARRRDADRSFSRIADLYKSGAVSQQQFDTANATHTACPVFTGFICNSQGPFRIIV